MDDSGGTSTILVAAPPVIRAPSVTSPLPLRLLQEPLRRMSPLLAWELNALSGVTNHNSGVFSVFPGSYLIGFSHFPDPGGLELEFGLTSLSSLSLLPSSHITPGLARVKP